METTTPSGAEKAVGVLLLVGAAAGAGYLVMNPDAHSHYAWGAAGIAGLIGLWLFVPVRAQAIWHELRAALPILANPPADDGHNHG